MMTFSRVITRKPASTFLDGITHGKLGKPDFDLALSQHEFYCESIKKIGITVIELDSLFNFPDSTFVEDVAVLIDRTAIITRPGADSRRQEIDYILPILKSNFSDIRFIEAPRTLDGGDVMMVGNHFYIGLSERTNNDGAQDFIDILKSLGKSGETVELKEVLHLKTGVSYLENNNLLVSGEFVNHPAFSTFHKIVVPSEEAYAANAVWMNGFVLFPQGFPKTQKQVENLGYNVIEIPMSEFEKQDGGLSCLSLRW